MIVHDKRDHYDLRVGQAPALVAGRVNDMSPMEDRMTDASRDVVLWGSETRVALSPTTTETTWMFNHGSNGNIV